MLAPNRRCGRGQDTPSIDGLAEGDCQSIQDGIGGARLAGPRNVHLVVDGHLDHAAALADARVIKALTAAALGSDTQLPPSGTDQLPRHTGEPAVASAMLAPASGQNNCCGRERNKATVHMKTVRSAWRFIT